MKHYNEDPQCCYPQNNTMEICKNCARYIENKKDGEYIIVDYRASGRAFISTLESGEQSADIYCDCHEGTNYMMYEQFDDGMPEETAQDNTMLAGEVSQIEETDTETNNTEEVAIND